jgi:hypothetical protein
LSEKVMAIRVFIIVVLNGDMTDFGLRSNLDEPRMFTKAGIPVF